jgi:phage tail sheath protein FI
VANIGGAFVGVAQKGPAFVPVVVSGQQEFENRFGTPDEYSYLGYTVRNYLQEASQATVVRVLGLDGYAGTDHTSATLIANDGGTERVLAVFHPTVTGQSLVSASVNDADLDSLVIALSGSTGLSSFSAVNPSGSSTANVINTIGSAVNGTAQAYTYAYFPSAIDADLGGAVPTSYSLVTSSVAIDFGSQEYNNATTPWIRSQLLGGSRYNLFKVHTLADGTNSNNDVKISIQSIKYRVADGTFGTFTLLVRRGSDTDTKVEVLEQWDNLTLDPNSPDYIARRIGNSSPTTDVVTGETYYQGDFNNKSQFIRLEVSDDVSNGGVPEVTLPYGFAAVNAPFVIEGSEVSVPAQVINTAWVSSSVVSGYKTGAVRDSRKFYGFEYSDSNYTNQSFLAPIPDGSVVTTYIPTSQSAGTVAEFSLDNTPTGEVEGTDLSISNASHITYRKFTVPLQGGFDGFEPNRLRSMGADITSTNSQGFDISTSTAEGSRAFKKAIDQLTNAEAWDINLLVVPGVNYQQHPYICSYAITVCEDRQDTFYIMDLTSYSANVATATSTANTIDSSYAGAYFPWVRVINTDTNKFLWAPPSVVLPEVFAYSDSVSAEWFAPAGLNRGGIPGASGVSSRLNRTNRDELYENKVNPIAQFPGQGIVAFGQKTLQTRPSALDRINVRRMVLTVKKFIASSSRYLLFEQNTEATRQRFLNIVNPYLASVQERQGLYAFRVVMDETNNTPDVIDRNQLVGQIYLQPTRTAEFIILDFNILPTGATFGS